MSVCPGETDRLPLDRFLWDFILEGEGYLYWRGRDIYIGGEGYLLKHAEKINNLIKSDRNSRLCR
jgi:hypothetical protein